LQFQGNTQQFYTNDKTYSATILRERLVTLLWQEMFCERTTMVCCTILSILSWISNINSSQIMIPRRLKIGMVTHFLLILQSLLLLCVLLTLTPESLNVDHTVYLCIWYGCYNTYYFSIWHSLVQCSLRYKQNHYTEWGLD